MSSLLLFGKRGILPFADSFARANGVAGYPWEEGVWAIAAGVLGSTPVLGVELGTDVDMEDDPASNWTSGAGAILGNEAEERTGGAGAQCLSITNPAVGNFGRAFQPIVMPAGTWFELRGWIREVDDSTPRVDVYDGANYYVAGSNGGAAWAERSAVFRLILANPALNSRNTNNTANRESRADDFSIKAFTLAELLNVWDFGIQDVVVGAKATLTAGTQCGVALCWDAAKTSGVIAYHDGTNCKLDKCVAGIWSTVITGAAAYGAGRIPEATRVGTAFTLKYNGAQIGATTTISNAEIIWNTYGGVFNTRSGNTLDDFYVRKA